MANEETVTTVTTEERVLPYRGHYRRVKEEEDETATSKAEQLNAATQANEPVEELKPEEKTYKKRYGDLKGHYDRTVGELRTRIKQLETATARASNLPNTPITSAEDLQHFRDKFPEAYKIMKAISRLEKDKDLDNLREEIEDLKTVNQQTAVDKAILEIKKLHPDFDELSNSADFHDWAAEQDQELQDWVYNNPGKARLAIRAIDIYKNDRGIVKNKSKAAGLNADAALEVNPRSKSQTDKPGKKIWTTAEIARLSERDFDRLEDEIDAARKEGRIRD